MRCKRHARDKAKVGAENGANSMKMVQKTMQKRCKHGKRCKSAENDASERYAKEKSKASPRRKRRESMQDEVQNQNRGAGSVHRCYSMSKKQ